jgi:predicted aldo/keto reductase-like oxidoreductase
MDRGLFDEGGNLVRRLQPGEHVRQAGHRVRLLPSEDQAKIDAVKYVFERFASADIGLRNLARELTAKGFPSPNNKGWTHNDIRRMLRNPAYAGTSLWGVDAWGKYHQAQGEDIVSTGNDKRRARRQKPEQDAIAVEGAHEGIISPDLFNRVQAKLPKSKPYQSKRKKDFPLSGLLFCEHCGKPMYGQSARIKSGDKQYRYHKYVCSSYVNDLNPTCDRHTIDADRVLGWLVGKLQEVYLGPGRNALVEEIRSQLQAQPKANDDDLERLKKRAADLEKEVNRLVKAIRTIDADELVEELALVQAERERVKAQRAEAAKLSTPLDVDTEAERIADILQDIGQRLTDGDPAVVREVLGQFVSKITCRWEPTGKACPRSRLVGGRVELRPQVHLVPFDVAGRASSRLCVRKERPTKGFKGIAMQYRLMPSTGDRLSALGFGCMRLPVDKKKRIDEQAATRLVHKAIDAGVNYFDTAFGYHNEQSEPFLGRALAGGHRDKVKIATKLPHWLVREPADIEKLFIVQLNRLQTDRIDYYLIHILTESRWKELEAWSVVEFIDKAKRDGRIGHIGFSSHVGCDEFKWLVDAYDWEFTQIQYNYLDTLHQAGREGLRYAAEKGLGMIIMEPLRGGKLAQAPPAEVQAIWDRAPGERRTPAEWALRWIWSHPQVHVILSGMTTEEQLDENLETVETAKPNSLTEEELALVDEAAAAYRSRMKAGCTGCRYCMPCPANVNIPECLQTLDSYSLFGNKASHQFGYLIQAAGVVDGQRHLASQCVECGKCVEKCPQNLPIPELLKETSKTFEGFFTRLSLRFMKVYLWFARRRSIR